MFKKILGLCVVAFVLLGVANIVTAQTEQVVKQINIQSLVLDKTTFNAGDEVNGKFVVSNPNTTDFNDVYYKVSLVGAYDKNNFPNEIYNSSDLLGPDLIPANKNNEVDFYYNLPKNIAGDLGIQVRALTKAGKSLAWTDVKIKVKGQTSLVSFEKSELEIAGKKYSVGSGPMVNEGQKVTLLGTLSNPAKTAYTVTPVIKVYDRVVVDTPMYSKILSPIALSAGAKKDLSIDLPLFDYTPKVYAGTVEFLDQQGVSMSAIYDFRYIVAGDIVTVQSTSLTGEGNKVQVETTFTGAPFDISTGETRKQGNGTMSVSVSNEKGDLLGTNTTEVSLDGTQSVSTEVDLKGQATDVQVKVEIKKGDKVIAVYTAGSVPHILDEVKTFSTSYIIAIALILILLFIVGVTLIKRKISKTLIVCLLIVAGLSVVGFGSVAIAGVSLVRPPAPQCPGRINGVCPSSTTVTPSTTITPPTSAPAVSCNLNQTAPSGWTVLSTSNPSFANQPLLTPAGITVNISTGNALLQPGQSFSLQFNVIAWACANEADVVGVAVTSPSNTAPNQALVTESLDKVMNKKTPTNKPANLFISTKDNGWTGNSNSDLFGGTYTAPTTPGTYRVYFSVKNWWVNGPVFFGQVNGYKEIVVAAPCDCPVGKEKDASGNCVDVVVTPTDVCPLIEGIQLTLPCTDGSPHTSTTDLCPLDDGIQTTLPCPEHVTTTPSGDVSCYPVVNGITASSSSVGQLVKWVSTSATTTYNWSGTDVPSGSSANTLEIRYATGGKKTVSLNGASCTVNSNTNDGKFQVVALPILQPF